MLLADALQEFLYEYDNRISRSQYKYELNRVFDQLQVVHLGQITPFMLKKWRSEQFDNLALATVNGRIAKVKRFFRWCVESGYLVKSPADGLKKKRVRLIHADKAAPHGLVMQMLEETPHQEIPLQAARDMALLAMLAEYGVRRGDAASARLSGITDKYIILTQKGGHERALAITPGYRPILTDYINLRRQCDTAHDALFVGIRRPYAPLTPQGIEKTIRRLSKMCGGNIGPHAIRHWLGQRLADAGVPISVIQAILGHAAIETTIRFYLNQGDDRVQNTIMRFSVLEKPQLRVLPKDSDGFRKASNL